MAESRPRVPGRPWAGLALPERAWALPLGAASALCGVWLVGAPAALALLGGAAAVGLGLREHGRSLTADERSRAVRSGLLGVLAVGLALHGLVVGAGSDDLGDSAADRARFCRSDPGQQLSRAAEAELGDVDALRRASADARAAARKAPPGSPCAVIALDALALSWSSRADDPAYRHAGDEVDRIRQLQRRRGLDRSRF